MEHIQWYTKTIPEILDALNSREQGLKNEEASERLKEYGLNKLPEGKVAGLPVIFFSTIPKPLNLPPSWRNGDRLCYGRNR